MTCGKGGNKRRAFFSILLIRAVGERGEKIFENGGFLERECNFYLNFPIFEPSVRVGPRSKVRPRSKVVLRGQGLRVGTGFGEFRQLQEVGVFSYSVIFSFKSLVNGLADLKP